MGQGRGGRRAVAGLTDIQLSWVACKISLGACAAWKFFGRPRTESNNIKEEVWWWSGGFSWKNGLEMEQDCPRNLLVRLQGFDFLFGWFIFKKILGLYLFANYIYLEALGFIK